MTTQDATAFPTALGAHVAPAAGRVAKPDSPTRRPAARGVYGFLHSRAFGWTALLLLFAGWQVSAYIYQSPGLPAPSRIAATWAEEIGQGDLLAQLFDTLISMVYGLAISIALGLFIGVSMARVKTLYGLFEPIVELWRPIPSVVFIPVIILYFGLGRPMNVLTVVLAATESVILNSYSGVRAISPSLLSTAATFRLSPWQTLREIVLPAAAPQIFVGFRLALAKSLVIAVSAGMIAGNAGIGFYVVTAQQTLDIPKMFAGAFTVALVGYLLNLIFVLSERRLLHWHAPAEPGTAA